MGETRNLYKTITGKPKGTRLLKICTCICILESNIKMDLREIGCKDVDLIQLAQNRVQ